jgi:hypothetical protein
MRRVFYQSVIHLLELPLARSEHAMNIFYIIGVVVVVILVAGFLGVRV